MTANNWYKLALKWSNPPDPAQKIWDFDDIEDFWEMSEEEKEAYTEAKQRDISKMLEIYKRLKKARETLQTIASLPSAKQEEYKAEKYQAQKDIELLTNIWQRQKNDIRQAVIGLTQD
jgi:hypothetical protein